MLGQPTSYANLVLKRMNQESGGNPTIVNKWDSNWKAGHPSVGLMQVIRGTFAAYAGKYRKTGPFEYGVSTNAMANIYAGLNYAIHRYGSLAALGRPGGYDLGGIARGMGYMPKYTNEPERVLSPRQTAAFERLVSKLPAGAGGGRGGGGGGIHIEHLHVDAGVIGSQHEMENWLVRTTVNLKKKGRIT
jgi:SLT domain-containing protein